MLSWSVYSPFWKPEAFAALPEALGVILLSAGGTGLGEAVGFGPQSVTDYITARVKQVNIQDSVLRNGRIMLGTMDYKGMNGN